MRALYNIKNFWYHIIKEEVSLLHRMIRGVTNMSEFKKIQPEQVSRNPFTLIGRDWALLTGGTPKKCNPMTVSWGGVGVLWNKPVATVYVRPQRYTLEMLYAEDQFTLCFFEEGTHRDTLAYCGKVSGRDTDKVSKFNIELKAVEGSAIQIPVHSRVAIVCSLKEYHEVGDHVIHLHIVEKCLDAIPIR